MDVKFIRNVGVGSVAIGFVIGIIASIVKKRERKINYFGVRTSKKKKWNRKRGKLIRQQIGE